MTSDAVIWHDVECSAYDLDLALWRELAEGADGPVLDIGAGTGRVAIDLARHGYEVIRLLEERFQGLYAPSAGTVYPRLAKLEAEGLVTHTPEGGRKVYAITDAGRAGWVVSCCRQAGEGGDLRCPRMRRGW